jgi:hypothetical protein
MSTHDRATADDASQKRTGLAIGDKATYGFITLPTQMSSLCTNCTSYSGLVNIIHGNLDEYQHLPSYFDSDVSFQERVRSSADTPYKPDTVVMAMERGSQRLAEIGWSADSTNSRASPTGHPLPALLLTEVESVMAVGLRLAETPMLHVLAMRWWARSSLPEPKSRRKNAATAPQTPVPRRGCRTCVT